MSVVCIILVLLVLSNWPTSQTKYIILTSSYYPLVTCTTGNTGLEASKFSGIQIDMLRKLASYMNWTDSDWEMECISSSNIQTKLSDYSTYLGYFGPFSLDRISQLSNVQYSQPLYQSGLSIITYQETKKFVFFKIIKIGTLALIVASAFVIAILQFFFEGRDQKVKQYSIEYYFWHIFSSIFFIGTIKIKQHASKILQSAFWFMIFVIVAIYFAKITNELTLRNITNYINSPLDLNQKVVKVNQIYNKYLYTYNAKSVKSTYGPSGLYSSSTLNSITETMVKNDLKRSGNYRVDAFVTEDILAKIVEHTQCDMYIKSRNFQQLNYPIIYSSSQGSTIISSINNEIYKMQDNQLQITLENSFLEKNYALCKRDNGFHTIDLDKVNGLFIMMAVAIAISVVLFVVTKFSFYKRAIPFFESINLFQRPQKIPPKQGDELVVSNLKEDTKNLLNQFQIQIKKRLDEMDQKVLKFYEILLNEEYNKKQVEIQKLEQEIQKKIQDANSRNQSLIQGSKQNKSKSNIINQSNVSKNDHSKSSIKNNEQNNNSRNLSQRNNQNNIKNQKEERSNIDEIIAFSDKEDSERSNNQKQKEQGIGWQKVNVDLVQNFNQIQIPKGQQSQQQMSGKSNNFQKNGQSASSSKRQTIELTNAVNSNKFSNQAKQSNGTENKNDSQNKMKIQPQKSNNDEEEEEEEEEDDDEEEEEEEEQQNNLSQNQLNKKKSESQQQIDSSSQQEQSQFDNQHGVINDDFEDILLNNKFNSSNQKKK